MITAAASIVFALLSASPERIGKMQAARTWFKDFIRGRSKLRDLKPDSVVPKRAFFGSQPNILIYEDRVKLQKDQYWEMMQEIMGNRKQIYEKMSDHLYWFWFVGGQTVQIHQFVLRGIPLGACWLHWWHLSA